MSSTLYPKGILLMLSNLGARYLTRPVSVRIRVQDALQNLCNLIGLCIRGNVGNIAHEYRLARYVAQSKFGKVCTWSCVCYHLILHALHCTAYICN